MSHRRPIAQPGAGRQARRRPGSCRVRSDHRGHRHCRHRRNDLPPRSAPEHLQKQRHHSPCTGRATGIDAGRTAEDVVLVVLFLVVMYTDFRWLRIPNVITYPTMVIGLAFGAAEGIPGGLFIGGLADHVLALVLAFAIAYPFYAAGGLKAGDSKLLMAIGAVRGTNFLFVSAVYGAIIGGIIALGFIATRRLMRPAGGAEVPTVG